MLAYSFTAYEHFCGCAPRRGRFSMPPPHAKQIGPPHILRAAASGPCINLSFTSLRHAVLCGALPGDAPGAKVDELRGRRAAVQRMARQRLHVVAVMFPRLLHRAADVALDPAPGAAACSAMTA